MASVGVRTATGLLIAALVVACLYCADFARPGLLPWIVGLALGLLGAFELGRMGRLSGPRRAALLPLLCGLSAAAVLAAVLRDPAPWAVVRWYFAIAGGTLAVGTLLGAAAPPAWNGAPQGERSLLQGPLGFGLLAAWIGPAMAGLGFIHGCHGTAALSALIVLSKLGDVAGYFVGKAIGRSHPFPKLSPGKTTAGCVASLVAGVAAGVGMAALDVLPGAPSLAVGAFVGGILNIVAQAADLFESFVKRTAAVKDSSGMAGASGGILDVVDSLLFTVPVSLVLFAWLST